MKRSLREKCGIVALAGFLLSFLVGGWSSGEETAEPAGPDAGDRGSVLPPPEPPEPAPIVAPILPQKLGLDTVVAMVNGEAITLDELQRRSKAILETHLPTVPPKSQLTVKELLLKRQLENIIDEKLILMEAKQLGARVEDSRVREYIRSLPELRTTFNGDLADFLVAKGISYGQLKKEIEERLLFKAIIRGRVLPKVRVPPGEVRQFYQRNIEKFTEEAAVHCFAISFFKRDNLEAAAAVLTKAREALRKINQGAYFPDVAKEYSEDPTKADKGGDWGWITSGSLEKKASDAAFALKEGEYSGIVEADVAYWILWAKKKREESVIPLSAAWKEIELVIKTRKQDVEIRKWGRRLRLKAAVTYPVPVSEIARR